MTFGRAGETLFGFVPLLACLVGQVWVMESSFGHQGGPDGIGLALSKGCGIFQGGGGRDTQLRTVLLSRSRHVRNCECRSRRSDGLVFEVLCLYNSFRMERDSAETCSDQTCATVFNISWKDAI